MFLNIEISQKGTNHQIILTVQIMATTLTNRAKAMQTAYIRVVPTMQLKTRIEVQKSWTTVPLILR